MTAVEYILARVDMTPERTEKFINSVFHLLSDDWIFGEDDKRHMVSDLFEELTGKEAAEVTKLFLKEAKEEKGK